MIQHRSMSQCTVPTQNLSNTTVHRYTKLYAQKVQFLQFWNHFVTTKMWGVIPDSPWQAGSYDCEESSQQVKSEFASQKVSNLHLSHRFQWLLFIATAVAVETTSSYAMHDGQGLIHPLSLNRFVLTWHFKTTCKPSNQTMHVILYNISI